ncbi:alpha-1,3-mannosyl-glycoprotein 4-beta-N-acetylglucosaminyltransferase A [Tachysurus ichikawai]
MPLCGSWHVANALKHDLLASAPTVCYNNGNLSVILFQDKDFLKPLLHKIHVNPPAEVSTSLKVYQGHTLEKTYMGEDFFWAITPMAGDYVLFKFDRPVSIERFLFRSGNQEHPGDKIKNTTVEIMPFPSSSVNFPTHPPSFMVKHQQFPGESHRLIRAVLHISKEDDKNTSAAWPHGQVRPSSPSATAAIHDGREQSGTAAGRQGDLARC